MSPMVNFFSQSVFTKTHTKLLYKEYNTYIYLYIINLLSHNVFAHRIGLRNKNFKIYSYFLS